MSLFKKLSEVHSSGNPYLVEDFVHQQATVIFGRPEAGKSFVALSLAHALATGSDWMGRQVAKTKVALWALDPGGDSEAKDRYNDVPTYQAPDDEVLIYAEKPDWRDGYKEGCWQGLVAELVREDVKVLIIDNLLRLMPPGKSIRLEEDIALVTSRLDEIIKAGISVVLLHHKGKNSEERQDAKKTPMGSTGIESWARHLVDVDRYEEVLLDLRTFGNNTTEKHHYLAFVPKHETKDGLFMKLLWTDGDEEMSLDSYEERLAKAQIVLDKKLKERGIIPSETPEQRAEKRAEAKKKREYNRQTSAVTSIVDLLSKSPDGVGKTDIYKRAGLDGRLGSTTLDAMETKGQVAKHKNGKTYVYKLTAGMPTAA